MTNGKDMMACENANTIEETEKRKKFSIVNILEKTLNGKVDELLKLQEKITKDLEKIIEKLSM